MNVLALSSALLSLALPAQNEEPAETTLQRIEREIAAVVRQVRPSVVRVSADAPATSPLSGDTLIFSGVVYTKDGAIVTDASGVESADGIRVRVGARSFLARHLASDRRTGVAVLKIDARGLSPARLAEGPCRPGMPALAVGNALGFEGTASFGAVSAVGRAIVVGGRTYDDMIQLAAAFSPGDCGAFLADSRGRLLGLVHSAYEAVTPGERRSGTLRPSIGFATPAAWVKFSADRILKHGRAVRGWVGLTARPLAAEVRDRLGLPEGVGAEIVRLKEGGPAGRSGIVPGDVLVEFGGKPVRGLDALRWKIAEVEQPTTVKMKVLRDGKRVELKVRVEIESQE